MAEENNQNQQTDYLVSIGSSGLERTNGTILEEYLKELQGQRGVKVYKEMRDNDPTVGAIYFAIKMLIRQVEWRVEEYSDSEQDKEVANFIDDALFTKISWPKTLSEILSFIIFGWSALEIVLQKDEETGKITLKKLPLRGQESLIEWLFDDETDEVISLIQEKRNGERVEIPMTKLLHFVTESNKENPEGRSILRNAYRPWYFKKNIENIEGIGIERDLAGLPMALVPPKILDPNNSNPSDRAIRAEIEKIVKNVRRDEQEGIIWPSARDDKGNLLYEFKLLTTGGTRQFNTDQIITRYDQRIAMTMLADFILLGHDKVGSFSLASSKTALFSSALGAFLETIADEFNRKLIPLLCDVNGYSLEGYPQLTFGDIEKIDLTVLGQYITALTGAGVQLTPDEKAEKWLKDQAGIPTSINEEFNLDLDESELETPPTEEEPSVPEPQEPSVES